MKKNSNKALSYLGVLLLTLFFSATFLLSSHYKMLKNRYTFERVITSQKICEVTSSELSVQDSSYIDIVTKTGYTNAIGYVEVDSSISYIALVKPDSMPIYPSGIYKYDKKIRRVDPDSCLCPFKMEDSYTDQNERLLAYSCKFIESSNYLALVFLHFSDIFLLNKEEGVIKRFKTKDDVPPPSIIRYNEYYLYERGKTFNTNRAAFVYDNRVYVFSLKKPAKLSRYMVDCYSMESKDYLYSFYIDNIAHEDNLNVYSATIVDDIVTIQSKNCVTKIRMI